MHAVLLLFQPLPNVGIQNLGMWGMYDFAKAFKSIKKPIANSDLSNMAELPSFSPPASESTLQYRTSPLR